MEAETYLSSGFGIRLAIEGKAKGWTRFSKLARVWMPGRLKGIQVSRDFGTPFLAATQAYDIRPIPRKWLALSRTADAANRFVQPGMILVTCSGSVGRATLAYAPHENTLISHDLLRVEALDQRDKGWLYAYLHSPQVRAMTVGAHYGHIIKHLETSHLEALPIPTVDDSTAADFSSRVARILELRNAGYRLTMEAEARFEKALGPLKVSDWGEKGFTVKASKAFLGGRRRFDASVHNPGVITIRRHLAKNAEGFTTLVKEGYCVWVPGRYKRVPAQDGVIYRDSADLLEVSPDLTKRFADCRFGDDFFGRVKSGWILMPCSGQVYGIIGTAILATEALDNQVVSNHVIRVAPEKDNGIRIGYVVTALSHPQWGRPVVKALAFGSSVPEIESEDLANLEFVRLKPSEESVIADLAEASAKARASADVLEREIAQDAGKIIERFIS
ncbi:MAG: hypothetical protein Q8N04_18510 [Nitrospira sp.]|nr:hypothetical protein [Nitrospira sp.]